LKPSIAPNAAWLFPTCERSEKSRGCCRPLTPRVESRLAGGDRPPVIF
jgi:hypothetical protein